jgi:hypothetical protein
MTSLAVRLLGEFSIDGYAQAACGSKKARLTLQLLALAQGDAVPAEVLSALSRMRANWPPPQPHLASRDTPASPG